MLLLIALFVWIGATQESAQVQLKSSLAGATVREAMLTDFRALAPDDRLGEAARLLLAGSQRDFPVLQHGCLVGLLTHGELFRALREHGDDLSVGTAMQRQFDVAAPHDQLEEAVAQVHADRGLVLPVMDGPQLVGLLTPENLGEYFMIRSARAGRPTPRPPAPPPAPPIILSAAPPIIRAATPLRS
jgi:CBS domain-containing protein